jgi:uncharacterized membrane protein
MTNLLPQPNRLLSLDVMRGLVMVIMALDHVRDYFHADAFLFEPTDLDQASAATFLTRWITHFCAPAFVWLAGSSAYLYGKKHGKEALSRFLWTRGLWLIFLELTVLNFAWYFQFALHDVLLIVIWVLGLSMICLAGLSRLPMRWIWMMGLALVFGHNLLDAFQLQGNSWQTVLWAVVHQNGYFAYGEASIFAAYPLLPWLGVMLLGFAMGSWFAPHFPADLRRRWLSNAGYLAVVLFVLLRLADVYGEPIPLMRYDQNIFSFLSLLNTTKYPPSLLYLLMTLGPIWLLLAALERLNGQERLAKALAVIGSVPLFYYVVHLYVIHLLAMLAAEFTGFGWQSMLLQGWVSYEPQLKGYGFSLGSTYLIWLGIVGLLYPMSLYWSRFKKRNAGKWWVGYV